MNPTTMPLVLPILMSGLLFVVGMNRRGAANRPDLAVIHRSAQSMTHRPSRSLAEYPSEDEVWRAFSRSHELDRDKVRFRIEKVGETVYPLDGPGARVRSRYKCTLSYDELYWSDYPTFFTHVEHRVEILSIDKIGPRRPSSNGRTVNLRSDDRRFAAFEEAGSQSELPRVSKPRPTLPFHVNEFGVPIPGEKPMSLGRLSVEDVVPMFPLNPLR